MIVLFIYLISVFIFYIIFSVKAFNVEKTNIITFADSFTLFCYCLLVSLGWIIILPLVIIVIKFPYLRKE